jgi:hypothetical protein
LADGDEANLRGCVAEVRHSHKLRFVRRLLLHGELLGGKVYIPRVQLLDQTAQRQHVV